MCEIKESIDYRVTIIGIVFVVIIITMSLTRITISYIENGYTRKSIPGVLGTRWVKE